MKFGIKNCMYHTVLIGCLMTTATHIQAKQPNIIVIFTDDIGYGDISCLNPGSGFKTPAVNTLAKEGITFFQTHSTSGICAPSRYAFLTGNHIYRGRSNNGVWSHCKPSQILPDQQTIADVLRDNGYRTAFLGKSHMGAQFYKRNSNEPAQFLRDVDVSKPMFDGPKDHGFDYTLTLHSGIQHAPYAFFENDRLAKWDPESNSFFHFDSEERARKQFKHKAEHGRQEDTLTNIWFENYYMKDFNTAQVGPILTFKALDFMEQQTQENPNQPFFMHFCTEAAHYPYAPPVDLSPDDPDNYMEQGTYPIKGMTPNLRADMVYESDAITQCIVEKLKALNIYEDTILIYTSDNGAATYYSKWTDPKYFTFKWGEYGGDRIDRADEGRTGRVMNPQGITRDGRPLKGQKGYIAEGGHRVPFIMHIGNNIMKTEAGRTSEQLIGLHDVFATLCDLTGSKIPKNQAQDSVSFANILRGTQPENIPVRKWLQVQARMPEACEQRGAEEIATAKGLTIKRRGDGTIIGLEGPGAQSNPNLCQTLEDKTLGRAIYLQENGKRWKLTLTTRQHELEKEIETWELYKLISDPVEANNLINHPEHKARIHHMLDQFKNSI